MPEPNSTQKAARESPFPQGWPNPMICRTGYMRGANVLPDCLVNNEKGCPYVRFSGKEQFCTHPNWRAFLK